MAMSPHPMSMWLRRRRLRRCWRPCPSSRILPSQLGAWVAPSILWLFFEELISDLVTLVLRIYLCIQFLACNLHFYRKWTMYVAMWKSSEFKAYFVQHEIVTNLTFVSILPMYLVQGTWWTHSRSSQSPSSRPENGREGDSGWAWGFGWHRESDCALCITPSHKKGVVDHLWEHEPQVSEGRILKGNKTKEFCGKTNSNWAHDETCLYNNACRIVISETHLRSTWGWFILSVLANSKHVKWC